MFGRVQVEADGRGVVDDRHRHNVLERQHRVDRVEHQQQQLKQKQKFLHFWKYIIGAELVHVTKSILGFCEWTKSMEKRWQEKKISEGEKPLPKNLGQVQNSLWRTRRATFYCAEVAKLVRFYLLYLWAH